ncbi:MAG TPA: 30S ribosomal protein S6 [Chitinispirillaceae bacterium]|nr:30S ribosomal protein S6 [Chitinispirillaceae bacterium]
MKKPYESVIVFDGTLPEDVLHKEQQQIEEFLKSNSDFEKTDVWGKKALAYQIRKKKTGYYCMFVYTGEGGVVSALEHHIKLNESVLRHLTVVRNVKNDAARAAVFARKDKVAEGEKIQIDEDKEE